MLNYSNGTPLFHLSTTNIFLEHLLGKAVWKHWEFRNIVLEFIIQCDREKRERNWRNLFLLTGEILTFSQTEREQAGSSRSLCFKLEVLIFILKTKGSSCSFIHSANIYFVSIMCQALFYVLWDTSMNKTGKNSFPCTARGRIGRAESKHYTQEIS